MGSTGETKTEILERGEHSPLQPLAVYRSFRRTGNADIYDLLLGYIVIKHFGGKIPARPPKTPTGKVQNERAKRVADNRKDLTQLFDVVAQLLGYGTGAAPKRELLLEEGMIFLALPLDFRQADSFGVLTLSPHLPWQL